MKLLEFDQVFDISDCPDRLPCFANDSLVDEGDAIMTADHDRFQAIREIGPEISESLVSYFQEDSNRRVIDQLRQQGVSIMERPYP